MARIGVWGEWFRVGGRVSEQLGGLLVETDHVYGQKLTLISQSKDFT
jgi:hypothetical protein